MTGHWEYWNPVRITFGATSSNQLKSKIARRPYCLVTYPDEAFTPLIKRIVSSAGDPACLIREVEPCESPGGLHNVRPLPAKA
jgi:hypothetical protein